VETVSSGIVVGKVKEESNRIAFRFDRFEVFKSLTF
jgi:hypothetical protein